jgi:hypothetical protein
LDFSKKKITGNKNYDDLFFDGSRCQEIWITNIKLTNKKDKQVLFIVELYCYDGFSMIKFYPKSLKDSGDKKFKLRGKEFNAEFGVSQIRKILKFCGDIIYFYLDKFPNNLIGFVGQTDDSDDSEKKKRHNSQRYLIYQIFINTYFKIPKYVILDNERFNEFNIKLIALVNNSVEQELNVEQIKNYSLFIENMKSRKYEDLIQLMTRITQKKYIEDVL